MNNIEKIMAEIEEARYGLINDGLDVALQILDKYAEQEPCDDVVSRQMAIDAIERISLGQTDVVKVAMMAEAYMKKLPSVTQKSETVTEFADRCRECGKQYVKRQTGHWIYDNIVNNWRCDKCGETPKTMGYVGTADFMSEHFRFCNHCGAKMVEPQESEGKG